MLALSPTMFSTMGWPLEMEPITHGQNYFTSEYPFPHQSSSSPQSQVELERPTPSPDPNMVKKLNHNASERDRCNRINSLYSSLRSLLPVADQTVLSSYLSSSSLYFGLVAKEFLEKQLQDIKNGYSSYRDDF